MFKKQGTNKRSASTSSGDREPGFHEATPTDMGSQASACDMAWAFEELEHCEELDDVQLATVVGGMGCRVYRHLQRTTTPLCTIRGHHGTPLCTIRGHH